MAIIHFEDLIINFEGESLPKINLTGKEGEIIGIETQRDLHDRALNELFSCESTDFTGKAEILNTNLAELDDLSTSEIRKNLSLISLSYPLISNLKLIENAYLPSLFFSIDTEKELFQRAFKVLQDLGISAKFNLNPAYLTNFEKKLALFARTLMGSYKIIIFSRFFSDLDESKKSFLIDKILEHKKINREILVIIIERNLKLLNLINFDRIIKV